MLASTYYAEYSPKDIRAVVNGIRLVSYIIYKKDATTTTGEYVYEYQPGLIKSGFGTFEHDLKQHPFLGIGPKFVPIPDGQYEVDVRTIFGNASLSSRRKFRIDNRCNVFDPEDKLKLAMLYGQHPGSLDSKKKSNDVSNNWISVMSPAENLLYSYYLDAPKKTGALPLYHHIQWYYDNVVRKHKYEAVVLESATSGKEDSAIAMYEIKDGGHTIHLVTVREFVKADQAIKEVLGNAWIE